MHYASDWRAECSSLRRAILSGIGATQIYRLNGATWPCNHATGDNSIRVFHAGLPNQHRTQIWRVSGASERNKRSTFGGAQGGREPKTARRDAAQHRDAQNVKRLRRKLP